VIKVRFPALPDILRSSGSGTGSTQPREYNWGATWKEKPVTLSTWHPLSANLALTSPTSGGRLVGTIRSWIQATELNSRVKPHAWEWCTGWNKGWIIKDSEGSGFGLIEIPTRTGTNGGEPLSRPRFEGRALLTAPDGSLASGQVCTGLCCNGEGHQRCKPLPSVHKEFLCLYCRL
jgi:hypothetical protein